METVRRDVRAAAVTWREGLERSADSEVWSPASKVKDHGETLQPPRYMYLANPHGKDIESFILPGICQ